MLERWMRCKREATNRQVNLRFVFEGEEEAGSPHLAQYLSRYPKVLRPDAWILCDGPVHQSRRAELFFGARGTIDLELTSTGRSRVCMTAITGTGSQSDR
jgi:acetylornithine deacetylase/succinyl-diaminopimelate desuccinylase-like protein